MNLYAAGVRLCRQGALPWALWAAATCPAVAAPPGATLPPPRSVTALPISREDAPTFLSLDGAIRWALEHNPELAAQRQQHGIAAAAIVIARAYPFNPVWESQVRAAFGPESAGVTNSVPVSERVALDVEVRGQGKLRRETAAASLSRTDWEIANQELTLVVRVMRAFDTVVYRNRKVRLVEEAIDLNQRAAVQVEELFKNNRLTAADVIFMNSEVVDSRAQLAAARVSLIAAWQDLYRALGVTNGYFSLHGGCEVPPYLVHDSDLLLQSALERRPDLRARQLALNEADARVRLEIANRYGNPNLGPAYELNETRTNFVGIQFVLPIPILNTHRGEILQREAERSLANLQLRQNVVLVQQDLRAALARLEQARKWVETYERDVLPSLETALKDIRRLFEARAPGADLLRVIDVQRKLLKAKDTELDAVYELRQALADLAAAVGDPTLAVLPCPNP